MTGLAVGTPVTGGTIDTVAATIGAGAVDEGDFALTIGSSGRLCSIAGQPMEDPRLLNLYGAYDGQYIIVQSTNNACVSLRWFRDTFGREAARQAQAAGCGIYHIWTVWRTLPRPGPEPYMASLSGRGAEPVWDTRARGVFYGAGLETDYPSFIRAVLEGVAFSQRHCLEVVLDRAARPDIIPLGGGAANSLCGAGYLPMCWEFPWPGSGPMRQRPWAISSSLPRLWESVRLRRTLERCWQRTVRCFGPMMSGLVYMTDSTGFTGNCTRR